MHRPSSSLFLVSLVGVVGCGTDAPPPGEVRSRIATDLVAVIDQTQAATAEGASLPDTTQFSLVNAAVGQSFDALLAGEGDLALAVRPRLSRIANLLAPPRTTGTRVPTDPADDELDGAAAAQWLNDNIFTDANHAGDGIYTVPAALACTETQYDDQGNPIGEAVDPECAQAFGKLQLRVRVSEDDDVLRFALQLGPDHDEPLAIALSPTLLAVTVDLDETEDAVKALAPKFGEAAPNFALAGQGTAKIEILGAAAARLSLANDRDISIKLADNGASLDGPDAFRFSSKKATVFAVTLDGNAKSMQLALGLGETAAHIPDDFEGDVDVDLPGLTATATYAQGQPLQITGVSLGSRQTTVKVDGQTAVALDLNPNDGRTFDATFAGDQLTVTPRVDFRTQVDHAVLGDTAPVYDITRLFLEGGLRARTDGSVEVIGGTFAIDTNPASYGFSAQAGQCVSSSTAYDPTSGEPYEQFTVGTCN